jgi:sRNA-binding protein
MWQDHNEVIELLADLFPKAFIVDVRRRLPLKPWIEKDIDPEEVALAAGHPVDIERAVDWYTGSFSYIRTLLEGATRYDLDGNPAGTVTQGDEEAAKFRLRELNRLKREKRAAQAKANPVEALRKMDGVTHDQFKKIPAPSLAPAAPPQRAMIPAPAPPPPAVTIPAPTPPPAASQDDPAPVDVSGKQLLELAIKRIELAAANIDIDHAVAVAILRTATDAIESVIQELS